MNSRYQIVLASTSPFRKELLARLGLVFTTVSPNVDESAQVNELPQDLVVRLAKEKAWAVMDECPAALIIGSDQVASIGGRILGKPGSRSRAIAQLEDASGKRITFYTGLCLLNTDTGKVQTACEPFHVHFRNLSRGGIESYLDAEQPYQCAGSFKSEGLGISLFERLEGDDPNALIGLPLIQLVSMLAKEGVQVP